MLQSWRIADITFFYVKAYLANIISSESITPGRLYLAVSSILDIGYKARLSAT
jgi:hypothetical protein